MSGSLQSGWDWLTNKLGISGSPSMQGTDFSSMSDAGYNVPSSSDMSTASNFNNSTGGGMNWAGLSSGLGKLSDTLKSSGGAASSDPMQGSRSVASTVSGGVLQPQGAGGGASALASADTARNQLGQYLILAAMQGKGRGKSGGGLLG